MAFERSSDVEGSSRKRSRISGSGSAMDEAPGPGGREISDRLWRARDRTQIENEYGNFSNDPAYMTRMKEMFVEAGFTQSLLYTVDPSKALGKGEIDGVLAGVNFGTGHAKAALDVLATYRPGQPLFASEYWPGWFDLWGHPHETRPIGPQLEDLNYILSITFR